jgi:hypothetical protein
MMADLDPVSEHNSTSPPVTGGVTVAGADLGILLLRYSELRRDVARLRDLLEDLSQHVGTQRALKRSRARLVSQLPTPSQDAHHTKGRVRRRSPDQDDETRVRSRLERACLIALMESSEAVAVETIFDRIQRRGSLSFADYKHPFRAIVLAMGALVRRGEAVLSNEQGRRRWCWTPDRPSLEQPPTSTFV